MTSIPGLPGQLTDSHPPADFDLRGELGCRACGGHDGQIVLDLGRQPAADHFPPVDSPGPDPTHPLSMWLCAGCGLAQLTYDDVVAEEPRGVEPEALRDQARDAVDVLMSSGLVGRGALVAEYGSPHGGSWLPMLAEEGLRPVPTATATADAIVDCFGMMHSPDQSAAIHERTRRVAAGGVLLLQFHSLAAILHDAQWNALRHGHFAYYSLASLGRMLAREGFAVRRSWRFDLYGGTVLVAAQRITEMSLAVADRTTADLVDEEDRLGITDPVAVGRLGDEAARSAGRLRRWLAEQWAFGRSVMGYGAGSRAVTLLNRADVTPELLVGVADASPAKHGRRIPGVGVPIVAPADMVAGSPDLVLTLLPELRDEARHAWPEIEEHGGRWITVDDIR